MFYLQAGVHFHKVEIMVLIHQKFNRPRIQIISCFGGPDSNLAQFFTLAFTDQFTRALLDHLLLAPLQAAVSFREVDAAAKAVPDDLDFNVLDIGQDLFQIHLVIAKIQPGFILGQAESVSHFTRLFNLPDPLPAPAGRGLQ